jgi:hypothetical protein
MSEEECLRRWLAKAVAVLMVIDRDKTVFYCPICHRPRWAEGDLDHAPDCELAAVVRLAGQKEGAAGGESSNSPGKKPLG